ncbi:hypothetical protein SAMN05192539_102721 [Paraburkholderia diazotrophica]|uniref:Uncharacterized protein n=2 Tax=Paraburkholderia diazotrophica TaxID=667676 RepID=A0A1H7D960_9BURK|nr:hypothetical protein SAMN05192539_102721 [Paraburkholderia diazotrophica]
MGRAYQRKSIADIERKNPQPSAARRCEMVRMSGGTDFRKRKMGSERVHFVLAPLALDVPLTQKNIDKKAGPDSAGKKTPDFTREEPGVFNR